MRFYQNSFSTSVIPIVIILLLNLIFFQYVQAQKLPAKPAQWVMDYADQLDNPQEQSLNRMLKVYEDTTSNQIVVAIFNDAQDYPVEEFSIRLAESWKVGQKGRDNGIILAIFIKERKIRIEVGYGLEDMVPDAVAIQIAQNIIAPKFKTGDYHEGIYEGCWYLMKAASGKYKGIPKKLNKSKKTSWPLIPFTLFIIIILSLLNRGRNRATVGSRGWRRSGPFFWGGFGGGGFGGGSFGGGGGFSAGGGSFGGGGATGSW